MGVPVTRIMGGACDAGFGDLNAIIQNASLKPGENPVTVYQMWNRPPFAIATRKLGGAEGTPTTRLLPVFVQKNGLDTARIAVTNMAPNLQEPLLIEGDIDDALVFNSTSCFNPVLNRQDPDKEFNWMTFGDYGLDLYSNGLMVSQKLIKENPKLVAGLVRATNKAILDIAKDQNSA